MADKDDTSEPQSTPNRDRRGTPPGKTFQLKRLHSGIKQSRPSEES